MLPLERNIGKTLFEWSPNIVIEKEEKKKNRGFVPLKGKTFSGTVGRSPVPVE